MQRKIFPPGEGGFEDGSEEGHFSFLLFYFDTFPYTDIFVFRSVYAHMEELSEDSFYFFYKANLIEKLDFKKKLNSAHDFNSTEERWEICCKN